MDAQRLVGCQERFCRFALANPENRQRTVASLSMTDGTSTQLDETGT
jgi:hypothetical protein